MARFNDFRSDPFRSPGPGPGTPPPNPHDFSPGPTPRTPRPTGNPNRRGDILAWLVAVILLLSVPPMGVALIVYLAMNDKGRIRTLFHEGRSKIKDRTDRTEKSSETSEATRAKSPVDAGGKAFRILGWALLALALLMMLYNAGTALSVWEAISVICVALGGGVMLFKSAHGRKKAKQFARCLTVSGSEGVVELSRLAETLGMKPTALEKLLDEMIDHGYYGEKSYIDHARSLLVIDPSAMRDIYQREDEAKKTEAERSAAEQQTEYERIIREIEQADIDIEDEVMSEKIRRMRSITAAIFDEVEAHPEKRSQITRFMNYYLPTTLKLLNSYARIEAQGVTGENMAKAKSDIEGIADTLIEGYKNQLDTLYRAEAIDIAGDVSVIEKMMRSEVIRSDNPFTDKNQGQTMGGT